MPLQDDELDRMILGVVSRDFEPLESILSKLARSGAEANDSDIERRLVSLVADKFIGGYLLHAEPPYLTEVEINEVTIYEAWFYITTKGKKLLNKSSDRPETVTARRRHDPHSFHRQLPLTV